jgi:formylglycine-generating enzyme required for sulfatase activity
LWEWTSSDAFDDLPSVNEGNYGSLVNPLVVKGGTLENFGGGVRLNHTVKSLNALVGGRFDASTRFSRLGFRVCATLKQNPNGNKEM